MLTDPYQDERLRVTFANGLEEVGKTHLESRDACVKSLTRQLQNYHVQDGNYLNSVLVSNLIELKAVEAVDLIEEVFTNRELDEWITGSWAAAQVSLGLKLVPLRDYLLQYLIRVFQSKISMKFIKTKRYSMPLLHSGVLVDGPLKCL